MSREKCIRVRFTIYNEEVENTVNDRLKKKLLCFERALSTLGRIRGMDDRHNYTSSGLAAQTGGE